MRIYIGHASSYDYKNELYLPLKNSTLAQQHELIFPHENSAAPISSHSIIASCGLLIAEVSQPSIGLGIELGWAYDAGCRILCLHKENTKPSSALTIICDDFISYKNPGSMIDTLKKWLSCF